MKRKILLVDDDAAVLRATVRYLNKINDHEFEVVSCCRPEEALELVQKQPFDVVVSDMVMPEMDGVMFREAVSKVVPALSEKFVFVSGGGDTVKMQEKISQIYRNHIM